MNIKSNKSFGIVGYDIEGVNLCEMRQMSELKDRIYNVVASHVDDSKKNEYISDDDLRLMHAILCVFTKDYSNNTESEFDKFLKGAEKPVEQPKQEEKIEDEPIIDPYKD